MSGTYIPQPGTIPARALAYFQAQPPGHTLSSAVLADELDVNRNGMKAVLAHALLGGALKCEKREGLNFYSLGDGQRLPRDIDDEELVTPSVVAAMARKARRKVDRPARSAVVSADKPKEDRPLRVALWSDGRLLIERGQQQMELSPDETRQLVAYLERMVEAA